MNLSRAIIILAAVVSTSALPAVAEDSLTLSLETPSLESRTEYGSRSEAAASSVQADTAVNRSVGAENGKKVTVGRVAVVEAEKAKVYSKRSTRGRVYFTCPKGTPLAIVGEVGGWYGILMVDGSTGWVQKTGVRLLDYQLVATPPPATRGDYASRSIGDVSRSSAIGNSIVQSAFQYMGVPYVWGGNTTSGLDCSGFLKKVFEENGFKLPRTAREQATVGMAVGYDELQPGDRLYFCYKKSYIDHCGIYIGDGMFIHSSVSNHGVAVDKLAGRHLEALMCAMR